MNQTHPQEDDLEERQIYDHNGKLVSLKVDPVLEILYKLRPKIGTEYPWERVKKVEKAKDLLDLHYSKAMQKELLRGATILPAGTKINGSMIPIQMLLVPRYDNEFSISTKDKLEGLL